jgi:hypothetical protein
MAQPGGVEPRPEAPREDADDAPRRSKTRGALVVAVLMALLALGLRVSVTVIRTRLGHSDGKTVRPALVPQSVIGVVAAPHSVVYVVSAPSHGRSRVATAMRQGTANS